MASLTARAAAQMIRLPGHEQRRLLFDHKYPKSAPQVFKVPYYQFANTAFRSFFNQQNSAAALNSAIESSTTLKDDHKRTNNLRAIQAFARIAPALPPRHLASNQKIVASIGQVEYKLSPDIHAKSESGEDIYMYFHCSAEQADGEVARLTSEIAHWVLAQNSLETKLQNIEFVDLGSGVVHRFNTPRKRSITLLHESAQVIEALWSAI